MVEVTAHQGKQLVKYGFPLILVLMCNFPPARQTEAPASGISPAYAAVCRFVASQEAWATNFAEVLGARPQEKVAVNEGGHTFYSHVEPGLQLDYLVTADGRVLVAALNMSGRYLEKRHLTARTVTQALLLPHPLPDTLETGCDASDMAVSSRGGKLTSVRITFLID